MGFLDPPEKERTKEYYSSQANWAMSLYHKARNEEEKEMLWNLVTCWEIREKNLKK